MAPVYLPGLAEPSGAVLSCGPSQVSMIDLDLLKELFRKTRGRVQYRLGMKCKLTADSQDLVQIDCSGYVRWILFRASGGTLKLPDGSQQQLAWARKNLKPVGYKDVAAYCQKDPSRLFIAFLSPKPGASWPRHVWLLRSQGGQMATIESHGSGGVNTRPWNVRALVGCKECFEIEV